MLHICQLIHNALSKLRFKNIIFDLGGVLLDLNVFKTYEAFSAISGRYQPDQIKAMLADSAVFLDYEKGALTDQEFRMKAKEMLGLPCTDEVFDKAWNEMLGDLPAKRLELLDRLKAKHNTFLLSNTNQIHKECFSETVRIQSNGSQLDEFFTKAYYSHELKMRKPDEEIFQFVLSQNNLRPEDTVFLDDNLANLAGAANVGIQVQHVQYPEMIFSLF
jgi:epoxide hydrolase-like predicted phosphatase